MFQYSFLVVSRIRYSTDVVLPSDSVLPPAFDVMPQNVFILPFCNCFTVIQERKTTIGFDNKILNTDVLFTGNFRNFKYFQKHENEIRTMFRAKRWLKNLSLNILQEKLRKRPLSLGKNFTMVGLYLGDRDGDRKQIHEDRYIRKAMDTYREKYRNVLFVAGVDTSKTYNWFNHDFMKSRDIILVTETREEVILSVLSLMDHSIVLRDSISWWAAWLSKGSAVYFQHPFYSLQHNNSSSNHLDRFEFPAEWTRITVS